MLLSKFKGVTPMRARVGRACVRTRTHARGRNRLLTEPGTFRWKDTFITKSLSIATRKQSSLLTRGHIFTSFIGAFVVPSSNLFSKQMMSHARSAWWLETASYARMDNGDNGDSHHYFVFCVS